MSVITGVVRKKIDQMASRAQVPNRASTRKASGTAWTRRFLAVRGGAISAAGRDTTAPGAPRTRSGSVATAVAEAGASSKEKLVSPTSGAGCGGAACMTGAGDGTIGCSMLMVGADCGRRGGSRDMAGIDGGLAGAG